VFKTIVSVRSAWRAIVASEDNPCEKCTGQSTLQFYTAGGNAERRSKMKGDMLNILLVEDNDDHAELVQRNFAENLVANKIYHARDGEEALNFIFRRGVFAEKIDSPTPNLILLDLRLPRIDGIEVLKEIKASEKHKTIPVVILTSSQAEQDIARAYASNANSYLVKPVDFDKFTRMMKDLGYYWLAWNTHPHGDAQVAGNKI
jgi:CheY-like chemotaxis protein